MRTRQIEYFYFVFSKVYLSEIACRNSKQNYKRYTIHRLVTVYPSIQQSINNITNRSNPLNRELISTSLDIRIQRSNTFLKGWRWMMIPINAVFVSPVIHSWMALFLWISFHWISISIDEWICFSSLCSNIHVLPGNIFNSFYLQWMEN